MTAAPRDLEKPRSFLRNALPITAFLLLAGAVGPIFLVLGLVIDDPEAWWLLPIGAFVTATMLAIGLGIGWHRTKAQHKLYRLRLNGQPATGDILSFDQTSVRVNDQPMVKLRLRIHGDDLAPFEVETTAVVPEVRMPLLHGHDLPVLVDPETREWEIDWDNARPAPTNIGSLTGPPPVQQSPADRLAELDDLLRRDLVSREEYDDTRARILREI